MVTWSFGLLLAGLLCFVLAAVGVPTRRLNLIALGLAFLTAHEVADRWP